MSRTNKKGVSAVVGYVLLIVISISVAGTVYFWLDGFFDQEEVLECSEDVSISIKNVGCEGNIVDITFKNSGLFNAKGYLIRGGVDASDLSVDLSSFLDEGVGGVSSDGMVLFSEDFASHDEVTHQYVFDFPVNVFEVIPVVEKDSQVITCFNVVKRDVVGCDGGTDSELITVGDIEENVIDLGEGREMVEIIYGDEIVILFDRNEGEEVDLSEVIILRNDEDAPSSFVLVKNLELPEGETKAVYFDAVSGSGSVCVLDEELLSISSISDDCSGEGEVLVNCNVVNEGYGCEYVAGRYEVSGLRHSGVLEMEGQNYYEMSPMDYDWEFLYVDTFDDSGSDGSYGLNDNSEEVSSRQLYGGWDYSLIEKGGDVKVGAEGDFLSFHSGSSSVMLDGTLPIGSYKTYQISGIMNPVYGESDSSDWVSINLDDDKGGSFMLLMRANGEVLVYGDGVLLGEMSVNPAEEYSFKLDISRDFIFGKINEEEIYMNFIYRLEESAYYLSFQALVSGSNEFSTLDELVVKRAHSGKSILKYGFYDIYNWQTYYLGTESFFDDVRGYTNSNQVFIDHVSKSYVAENILNDDNCGGGSCVVYIGAIFHDWDTGIIDGWEEYWGDVAGSLYGKEEYIQSFIAIDEPYWSEQGGAKVTPEEYGEILRAIKSAFPDIPVTTVFAYPEVDLDLPYSYELDHVGFDCYIDKEGFDSNYQYLDILSSVYSNQEKIIVPQSFRNYDADTGIYGDTDGELAELNWLYYELALSNPEVSTIWNWGLIWPGFTGFEGIPLTDKVQKLIGASVVNSESKEIFVDSENKFPVGSFDEVTYDSIAKGWVYDEDLSGGSSIVDFYLDETQACNFFTGTFIGTDRADIFRSDAGGNYGFEYQIENVLPGEHTISVYAINYPAGANNCIGTKSFCYGGAEYCEEEKEGGLVISYDELDIDDPYSTNYLPVGNFDKVNDSDIARGWVYDKNLGEELVIIDFYLDETQTCNFLTGTFMGTGNANTFRPDVDDSFPGYGEYHGFDYQIENILPGEHTISVYAINYPAGVNNCIGFKSFCYGGDEYCSGGEGGLVISYDELDIDDPYSTNYLPVGNFDKVTTDNIARGWVYDKNLGEELVIVDFYLDETQACNFFTGNFMGTGNANTFRPDVDDLFPGYGDSHGFDYQIGNVAPGNHTISVYAINYPSGVNNCIGTKSFCYGGDEYC